MMALLILLFVNTIYIHQYAIYAHSHPNYLTPPGNMYYWDMTLYPHPLSIHQNPRRHNTNYADIAYKMCRLPVNHKKCAANATHKIISSFFIFSLSLPRISQPVFLQMSFCPPVAALTLPPFFPRAHQTFYPRLFFSPWYFSVLFAPLSSISVS